MDLQGGRGGGGQPSCQQTETIAVGAKKKKSRQGKKDLNGSDPEWPSRPVAWKMGEKKRLMNVLKAMIQPKHDLVHRKVVKGGGDEA